MRPSDPRLRRVLRPAARPLAGTVAAGVAGSLLVVAQAWLVAGLVVAVLREGDVVPWAVAVAGLLAARGLAGVVGDVCAARAAGVVGTDLRRRLTLAVVARPGRHPTGEVAALLTRGVTAAEPYLTRYLPALVLAVVLPPLTVVAIASQDLLSAVIVLATLPLIPVFGALVGIATRDRAEEQWRAMASLSGHFLDVVRGLPTLVAHRRARAQSARIAGITDRYRVATMRTLRLAFASSAVLELVATLSVALVAVTVGVRLASGSLDLGTALVVLLLAPESFWPLRRVGAEFHAAAEGVATFERSAALLADLPGETDASAYDTRGAVVLDAVTVLREGRTTPAMAGVSTVLEPQGVTVVTGPSGCGKTTLLAVVAGLLEPTDGRVTLDGTPLAGEAWRTQVAWLPQRPLFVGGSIGDNLRLSRPDADDDACWEALRGVALEERVRALPAGLDTSVHEDGLSLSAGERARLALARVVLADRPWTLLDEPTAHLDTLTEQVIADTIVELGRRRAVVVVAHRPAMVALADHHLELPAPLPEPAPATAAAPAPTTRTVPLDDPAGEPPRRPRFLLGTVLGSLASASGVALTATAGWLIVQASTHPPVLTMLVAIVGVRTFGLARPVLRYAERLVSHDGALRLLATRRVQVYDALVPLTPGRLGRRRGDLLASVVDDVDSVVDRELRVRLPIRTYAAVAALATLVAALLLPAAGLLLAIASLVTGVAAYGMARRGADTAERTSVALRARLSGQVVETIQVADELLMWQAEHRAADTVARLSDQLAAAADRATRWLAGARATVLVVTGAAVAGNAWVAAPAVADGRLSGPLMAMLVLLPLALADVALPVADAGALAARTTAARERLDRLEHTAPAVRDTVARPAPDGDDVLLEHASARWTADGPLTTPADLALAPGDRVALVGPSGCGKSTVAALLMRHLDPARGRVSLGGTSLRSLATDDVRARIGLVDDDPHVFGTTVAENVRLARPGADDAEVEAALRQARLGGWLDALPDGLGTWVGDGHAAVSGGERARIAIARSLLARQPVLVLDEPAAHLDHATATELAHEVLDGPRRTSVLWITHADAGLDLVDHVVDLGAPTATPTLSAG
ncbi:thiol reductant ABC exporter subunit CydD [Nocardioides euryhalodurans]|uniref:Thiol reductant ABC exporter subunit CydD n=1 Tax=Nocardioides euryhalodurans TaxID=2518370 RepID=A0A4P7GP47_9ACTN|nr:thiol reductant ABC exporter subunit CydD [Nocardioides euryhalodurans]QBR93880.1 thiol reductant ABC exporter subunit CydD [Nocardioides euryhalodurans]